MKLTLAIMTVATALLLPGAEPDLTALKKERAELYKKGVETRATLIRRDPELAKIQAAILKLQKELAEKLNRDSEIKAQNKRLAELDESITRAESAGTLRK